MVAPWQVMTLAGLQEVRLKVPWVADLIAAVTLNPEDRKTLIIQTVWTFATIAGGFLLLALVLAWLKRLRKRLPSERLASSDQLANYRILYEQGELSAEEYARIRSRLAQ